MASNHLEELTLSMVCENEWGLHQYLSQIITLVDKPHNYSE